MSRCTRIVAPSPVHHSALKIKDECVEEKDPIFRLNTMASMALHRAFHITRVTSQCCTTCAEITTASPGCTGTGTRCAGHASSRPLDARCVVRLLSNVDALANIPMDAHSALSPLFPLALPARSRHYEFLKIATTIEMPLFLLIVGLKNTLVILMHLSGSGQ